MPSNPTPETCRELADKLERYGESDVFRPGLFLTFMLGHAPTIITALRGYAAAAGDRWIPVSERLPNEYEQVVFWGPYFDNEPEFGFWTESRGWQEMTCEEAVQPVTHWMPLQPLPEPPKESEVTNG